MKKLIILLVVAVLSLSVASCGKDKVAQGVDTENHVITIGNTAATSGAFAGIGVPFNQGLEAYLWYYENHVEDAYKDAEGNKYTFDFKHYDDAFDGALGLTYTEKLVEEDEVFAIVGHFGTNTIQSTVDYLEEKEVPMVYAATGASILYDAAPNILSVQPIYNTEGRSMLASAVAPAPMGLNATKVGVIATTDEAGKNIKAGIIEGEKALGLENVSYQDVAADATDFSPAVNALKAEGCDVVIIAANQAPYLKICQQFVTSNYDNVSVITSYVSANYAAQAGLGSAESGFITATRKSFAGAWLYTGSTPTDTKGWKEFTEYVKVMTMFDKENETALIPDAFSYFTGLDWAADGISANYLNSFAMAGYDAANIFCQGLTRASGETLAWDTLIAAYEEAPINVPMGETINFADGNRKGTQSLALLEYNAATFYFGQLYRGLTGTDAIEEAYLNK